MRVIVFFAIALHLSACAANGPTFNEAALPKANTPVLVIYKNPGTLGMQAGMYDVDINGVTACKLRPGSFIVKSDVPAEVTITSSVWDMPGTSRLSMKAQPGKTHYVRIDVNNSVQAATIAGGVVGALLADGGTTGPFVIREVEPVTALRELQGIRQDCI